MTQTMEEVLHEATKLHQQGRLDEAERLYSRLLEDNPRHFDALNRLAIVALQRGNFDDALSRVDLALSVAPDSAAAMSNKGTILMSLKRHADALAAYDRVVDLNADDPDAHYNRATVLEEMNRPLEALASYEHAIRLRSTDAHAYFNRGRILFLLKRLDEAVASYDQAAAIEPNSEFYFCRGNALKGLGRFDDAMASYDQAIALYPSNVAAYVNRGNALRDLKRPQDALASFDQALAIKPELAEALSNRGATLIDLNRPKDALESLDKAVSIKPDYADALCNRGMALFALKRFNEAAVAYQAVLAIQPEHSESLAMLAYVTALSCNWVLSADINKRLRSIINAGAFRGECFAILSIFDDPSLQKKAAEGHRAHKVRAWTERPPPKLDSRKRRLRIGYLSADFGAHPVTNLVAGLIETHDRSFCKVYGFAASEDDDSPRRKRLTAAFDQFVDVARLSDEALCREVRNAEIDILIDLGGYTKGSRMLALAGRPAPIQISHLGYPGSVAAPFIDYMIADRFVVPKDTLEHYTEKVVYLPDCFQANDNKRPIASVVPTRAQCGLPESGFVFCAFHSSYKLNPETFDVWMRILSAVPGSVIWLSADAAAHSSLSREAQARGIDPARLVFEFATRQSYADYLARQKLADLFIDAWPYNGGTTVSDALWVGLPVLTLAGRSYAARMAGSLLHAIGLPELVTYSPEAYEALALRLASEPTLLNGMRQRLAANIKTAPLFDTTRYTRHLEAAYAEMWQIYQEGGPPQGFSVPSLDEAS